MYGEGEFSTFEAVTTEFKSRDEIYKSLAGTKEGRITAGHKSFYFIEDDYFTFRAFVVGAWEMGEKWKFATRNKKNRRQYRVSRNTHSFFYYKKSAANKVNIIILYKNRRRGKYKKERWII